jgi:hypothetical protein
MKTIELKRFSALLMAAASEAFLKLISAKAAGVRTEKPCHPVA